MIYPEMIFLKLSVSFCWLEESSKLDAVFPSFVLLHLWKSVKQFN